MSLANQQRSGSFHRHALRLKQLLDDALFPMGGDSSLPVSVGMDEITFSHLHGDRELAGLGRLSSDPLQVTDSDHKGLWDDLAIPSACHTKAVQDLLHLLHSDVRHPTQPYPSPPLPTINDDTTLHWRLNTVEWLPSQSFSSVSFIDTAIVSVFPPADHGYRIQLDRLRCIGRKVLLSRVLSFPLSPVLSRDGEIASEFLFMLEFLFSKRSSGGEVVHVIGWTTLERLLQRSGRTTLYAAPRKFKLPSDKAFSDLKEQLGLPICELLWETQIDQKSPTEARHQKSPIVHCKHFLRVKLGPCRLTKRSPNATEIYTVLKLGSSSSCPSKPAFLPAFNPIVDGDPLNVASRTMATTGVDLDTVTLSPIHVPHHSNIPNSSDDLENSLAKGILEVWSLSGFDDATELVGLVSLPLSLLLGILFSSDHTGSIER
jgi:hypothetical protein